MLLISFYLLLLLFSLLFLQLFEFVFHSTPEVSFSWHAFAAVLSYCNLLKLIILELWLVDTF